MSPDGLRPDKSLSHEDLALLAHEVRGALTVISGFSELLRRPLAEPDRAAALAGIGRAIERIDALMQCALEGCLDDQRPGRAIDLADLAESVAAEQRAITGRQVEVRVRTRPVIVGVADALERALGNLVDNALKYSLLDSAVEIGVGDEHGHAVLEIADRGPGIPDAEREHVFEPFVRLAEDGVVPGSGIGLAVVQSVVERHGGRVGIADREGGGTIVRIELPLASDRA